jgi:hypothetical protein
VTRAQLLALGWGRDTIAFRVRSGELIPVHSGVYAVGHVPLRAHERSMAAVLACGPGAVLSHAAALALYGLAERPATLEVTGRTSAAAPASGRTAAPPSPA